MNALFPACKWFGMGGGFSDELEITSILGSYPPQVMKFVMIVLVAFHC